MTHFECYLRGCWNNSIQQWVTKTTLAMLRLCKDPLFHGQGPRDQSRNGAFRAIKGHLMRRQGPCQSNWLKICCPLTDLKLCSLYDQGPVRPRPIFTVISPCVESGILQKRYTGILIKFKLNGENDDQPWFFGHFVFSLCQAHLFWSLIFVPLRGLISHESHTSDILDNRWVQSQTRLCHAVIVYMCNFQPIRVGPQPSQNGRCLLKPAFGEKAMEGRLKGRFL